MSIPKPVEIVSEHMPLDWSGGLLDCSCGAFEDPDEDDYPTRRRAFAEHVLSVLREKVEIVPTGTSAALGAFAAGAVTKQRVLEDIAYVLTGWRYEEPEDVWAAAAKVARDMGNAALVRAVEDSYAAAEVTP